MLPTRPLRTYDAAEQEHFPPLFQERFSFQEMVGRIKKVAIGLLTDAIPLIQLGAPTLEENLANQFSASIAEEEKQQGEQMRVEDADIASRAEQEPVYVARQQRQNSLIFLAVKAIELTASSQTSLEDRLSLVIEQFNAYLSTHRPGISQVTPAHRSVSRGDVSTVGDLLGIEGL